MSTRSQWSFREGSKQIALIYKHSDGYPDGEHGGFAVWERFIAKVKQDCRSGSQYGYRFDDAEYLSAKFLYYLIRWENQNNTLDFGGIGVGAELHGDTEYLYEIDCDNPNLTIPPRLRCKEVYSGQYVIASSKHTASVNTAKNPKFANDSHTRLRRDKAGHFIKMDHIAEFWYPSSLGNGCNVFRKIKVIKWGDEYIEGIQVNGNSISRGYKKFRVETVYDYNTSATLKVYDGYAD